MNKEKADMLAVVMLLTMCVVIAELTYLIWVFSNIPLVSDSVVSEIVRKACALH